jgi:hypothetical protein
VRAPARTEPAAPPVAEASAEQLSRPAGLRLTEPPASEQAGMAAPQVAAVERVRDVHDSVARSNEPADMPRARGRAEETAQIFRPLELAQSPAPATDIVRASPPPPLSTFQIALIVFAAISFLASGLLYVVGARRRRPRIEIIDLNARTPLRAPVVALSRTPSRRAATDGLGVDDERLRRFAQAWKQPA